MIRAVIRSISERHQIVLIKRSQDQKEVTVRLAGDTAPDAMLFTLREGADGLWYDVDAPVNSEGFALTIGGDL